MPAALRALTFAAILPLAGCMTVSPNEPATTATAQLLSSTGAVLGSASLVAVGPRLSLHVNALKLAPGQHGVHLHAVGSCARPDFASAGPHLNPASRQHGLMNPAGSHLGDLPNLIVGADGRGTLDASLSGEAAALLETIFDADGTAVVVHAAADDQMTDPSGNSGGRIACGVLMRR